MKAQSALEYLMIIALTLGVIVPTTYLFYTYSKQSTEQIIYPRINEIGIEIINNAESVYYSGEHSKIVMDVNMPEKINDINILEDRELVFEIETELGDNEMVFFSDIPIVKGDFTGIEGIGIKKIKLEAKEIDGTLKVEITKI